MLDELQAHSAEWIGGTLTDLDGPSGSTKSTMLLGIDITKSCVRFIGRDFDWWMRRDLLYCYPSAPDGTSVTCRGAAGMACRITRPTADAPTVMDELLGSAREHQ